MDPKDQRKYPRFLVSSVKGLEASIDRKRQRESIVTLGEGGCGFYGYDRSWPLTPVKRVFSTFTIGSKEQITIEGNIVYVKSIPMNGKDVVYYGVEFLPKEREKIKPIISELERLRGQGKVSLSG